ncbi:MAG: bsn 2 [Bacteroidota bacterium]|jgi:endonuclease I|nr:bsn 2 [Bacteroidota bacterium]
MKNIFLPLLISFAFTSAAQIPPGYYNSAAGLTGPALESALHNIIDNHNSVSYASLWTHFQNTDQKSNGKVWDMYSDVPSGTPPYEFTFGNDQCGNYAGEADCYNREHSWPQSWFNSATTPSSDLFHLYPTDGYVNNRRSNYPYGTVGTATWTSLNGGKLGACIDPGYTSIVFEPIDEYKGDLARSYFYMATRYLNEDASWANSGATNKAVLLPWQASVLLTWSHLDPVSPKETARNNAVYGIQNNRNPYIDHPEWADSIWTIIVAGIEENTISKLSVNIYPNPAQERFFIANEGAENLKVEITVTDALGRIIESHEDLNLTSASQESFSVNCEKWNKGVYYVVIKDRDGIKALRFLKM